MAAEPVSFDALAKQYQSTTLPLLKRFCLDCHSTEKQEGELDLERFATLTELRPHTTVWLKVVEMLDNGEMPPKDSPRMTSEQRKQLRGWVEQFLHAEALANAGDPGPVILRRLSNAEYTYTLRDLTGVPSLNPAHEFPVDGAAGEGFTNVGQALVMSPALLTKYLDAAKDVAEHVVLLPEGFHFSPSTTRSDWTNDALARIRAFYQRFADNGGGTQVNLQGIVFDTNTGGRLAVEKYLEATLVERESLRAGQKTIATVATERGLNAKYLDQLWQTLNSQEPSLLLDTLRANWRAAKPGDGTVLAGDIARWQQALWRFSSVGHIGKVNGPKAWQEPVLPLTARQEIRVKLTPPPDQKEITLYLAASDAGDGSANDFAVWERPRLVAPGRPEFLLRDVRDFTREMTARRERLIATTAKALNAAAEASRSKEPLKVDELARRHEVDVDSLTAWLELLGIGSQATIKLDHFTERQNKAAGYDFVNGWGRDGLPNIAANSSDQHVRIPGNMKPHGVCVHPSPTLAAAVGWQSPLATTVRIEGQVTHAHPECGNGVTWSLELRRGSTRQRLTNGIAHGGQPVKVGPIESTAVQPGDVVSLLIGPRDANHSCDLTDLELTLTTIGDQPRVWSLTKDVSPDIQAGNPHADRQGNPNVWHFYTEPITGGDVGTVIPAKSLLARWQAAEKPADQAALAVEMQKLLREGPPQGLAEPHPDVLLYRQLSSLGGPLVGGLSGRKVVPASSPKNDGGEAFGVDPQLFGKHPNGAAVDAASLCVQAPSVIEVRLPADLAAGAEFVATAVLHPETGAEGSVQFRVLAAKPEQNSGLLPTSVSETNASGPWTSNNRGVSHATPIVVNDGSAARQRMESAFGAFRSLFPLALCYTKIVPVDEVVTLTLFYREDDQLQRLMLNEQQTAELNGLWDELHFVSRDALTLVDAYQQLMEFATQDADPKVFEPLRQPILDRAAAFRKLQRDAEPSHVDQLVQFAGLAYRRPLTAVEERELRTLYQHLRQQELPHVEAFHLTLARVLVSPAFLYRAEKPGTGSKSAPISDWELATRLSYFLWSSTADAELRSLASSGSLSQPQTLLAQTQRMLRDDRARRLTTEFAAAWLHIADFERLDEKSERHFPTFAALRGPMAEESQRFFAHLFQTNASVLDLLDADYTFLNDELAAHYGIPNVTGSEWRRVDGIKTHGRGGILALATTLSKQSGASRTSPILRGNWLSEVVLGEKLPRPPKNVPVLPEDVPAGLTERQLIERHSSDASCAKCHARIDPFGFALENFDAIGRFRAKDAAGLVIDTKAVLPDGTPIDGVNGLREYLLTRRRDDFLRQFCKKLLGFALGRGVQLSDQPLIEQMQSRLAANDYRVWSVVETIVQSEQFRNIRPAAQ